MSSNEILIAGGSEAAELLIELECRTEAGEMVRLTERPFIDSFSRSRSCTCAYSSLTKGPTSVRCRMNGQEPSNGISSSSDMEIRTKHIDVKYHYIREVVERGDIEVYYIDGNDNPADMFTKNLGHVKFLRFREHLGLVFHR